MRKRVTNILVTGGAALAATAFGATAAFGAATSITVTNPNSDGAYTATTNSTTLTDKNTGVGFTCQSANGENASDASGTIGSGTYSIPHTFPDAIASLDFNNCNGPLGPVTATPQDLPYALTVVEEDASNPDHWNGYIGPVDVEVSMTNCSFTVTGDAPGYYDNSDHTLHVTKNPADEIVLPDGPLTISKVDNCTIAGTPLVSDGDTGTYEGVYTVDPAITIVGN